ncbi:MAG: 30S ribosome-binding factor RbfA [Holosporaceae bacterium]|jgi:ribosome-binding factor A|nr:30S ribosome-binding factor RbfA [Holosporaceae bacterium]
MQKKNGNRSQRVAAEIKKVLSEFLIRNSLGDKQINTTFLSITDVVVSSCLRHAKIYVALPSGKVDLGQEYIDFLKEHASRLRYHVGIHIKLKFVPDLSFYIDDSFDRAKKIESLLAV